MNSVTVGRSVVVCSPAEEATAYERHVVGLHAVTDARLRTALAVRRAAAASGTVAPARPSALLAARRQHIVGQLLPGGLGGPGDVVTA